MTDRETLSKFEILIQGIIIRLIYGLAGMGILALLAPHTIVNHLAALRIAVSAYFLVCFTGGVLDCRIDNIEDKRMYGKINGKAILWTIACVAIYSFLILTMN